MCRGNTGFGSKQRQSQAAMKSPFCCCCSPGKDEVGLAFDPSRGRGSERGCSHLGFLLPCVYFRFAPDQRALLSMPGSEEVYSSQPEPSGVKDGLPESRQWLTGTAGQSPEASLHLSQPGHYNTDNDCASPGWQHACRSSVRLLDGSTPVVRDV